MDLIAAAVIFLGVVCSCLLAMVVSLSFRLNRMEHLCCKLYKELEHQLSPFPLPETDSELG